MIHAAWLWVMLCASAPLGAFVGWLVFVGKMNATYTQGRRDGWAARIKHERELQHGHVVEDEDEGALVRSAVEW